MILLPMNQDRTITEVSFRLLALPTLHRRRKPWLCLCCFTAVLKWFLTIIVPVLSSTVPLERSRLSPPSLVRVVALQAIVGYPALHQPVWRWCDRLLPRTVEQSCVRHRVIHQLRATSSSRYLQCLHFCGFYYSHRKLWIFIKYISAQRSRHARSK